jgi:hypothetical protein
MLPAMTGKAPLAFTLLALLVAGCTTAREKPPTAPAPEVSTATPAPKPKPQPTPAKKRPASTTRSVKPAPPAAPVAATPPRPAAQINATVTRDTDNSLLVSRGPTTKPVPLFRQAIVLANVRAAVAGLPVQPKAEFNRGLLTLTFPPGSKTEATTAINKALSVPEVTRLRANLAP